MKLDIFITFLAKKIVKMPGNGEKFVILIKIFINAKIELHQSLL